MAEGELGEDYGDLLLGVGRCNLLVLELMCTLVSVFGLLSRQHVRGPILSTVVMGGDNDNSKRRGGEDKAAAKAREGRPEKRRECRNITRRRRGGEVMFDQ